MPSYDYECTKCNKVREEIHSIHFADEIKCECGNKMEKVLLYAPATRMNFTVGITKTPLEYYGAAALAKPSTFLDE